MDPIKGLEMKHENLLNMFGGYEGIAKLVIGAVK